MSLKLKKYNDITQFTKILNEESKSIWLIAHVNNFDILQSNILKNFCDQYNIKNNFIKLNLLRKITKNSLFMNLFAGPTKLFFFKDIESFLQFTKNMPLEKKIIPLAIYFNNNFFSYTFFQSRIFKLFNYKNIDNQLIKNNLILSLNNKSLLLLKTLPLVRNKFILFLTLLNNKINNQN